jgi:hypothetical protein
MSGARIFTAFYSWQSDLPSATNRGLIGDALENAAKTLKADRDIAIKTIVQRDTTGLTGSPDIIATILERIDASDAFVADISFITPMPPLGDKEKRCPNPNVLLELGYALRRHGWERVVMVFNEHYGSINDLPFDLRNRRVVPYRSDPDDTDRATPRKALQIRLESELRGMVAAPQQLVRTTVQIALEAIETEKNGRTPLVRKAVANVVERIAAVEPNLARSSLASGAFIDALDAATPAITDYLELARSVATLDDSNSIGELVVGLEPAAVGINLPPGYSGTFYPYQFDYWRHVNYELVLGLVAALLADRRYKTLGEVLRTRLHIPNGPKGGSDQVTLRYLNPRTSIQQEAWGQSQLGAGNRYISPIGQLLKERYSRPPLVEVVRWPEIQAADLFLHMWAVGMSLPNDDEPAWRWIGYAAVLLSEPPRFLTEAIRVGPARQLAEALNLPNPETVRDLYVDKVRPGIKKPFQDSHALPDLVFPNAHKIGSEP